MEEYQKTYLEKMGSRIEALSAASKGLGDDFFEAASSIRRLAHTLRGSGATYGFPEISELAAATEDADDDRLADALHALIEHLQTLYDSQRGDQERILVIDDSDEIRLMLKVIFEGQGYGVETAETATAGKELLGSSAFDLIILDLILPDMDGRNFLIKLRENPATAHTPVIVLSAKDSSQIKAECFALGADDYFEKPLDPALLTTRVAVGIQRSRQMEQQTHRDALTDLYNRAAFSERFETYVSQGLSEPACLAMLDLDHFKRINDDHGHLVGDKALKHIAEIFRREIQDPHLVARWGGEEFVILLKGFGANEAKDLLSRIQETLNSSPVPVDDGSKITLSFSAGVHPFDQGRDLGAMIGQADTLLYMAKSNGRKCILTPEDDLETQAQRILLAEDDDLTAEFILHRLRKDGFEIEHYERGDRALEAAKARSFDLAIFDVKMPGMEGFELLQRTRGGSVNTTTPIIMLTSMGSEQDISRGLALGANDYVLKPFSPMELMARIRRLLK